MAIIAPERPFERDSHVKRKVNNAKKLKVSNALKKASKAAAGAPEVMVKVTGFSRGGSHARSNIDYISRNGDLEIEDERGNVVKGRKAIKEFSKEWTAEMSDSRRKNQRDTLHMILSMPAGTPPNAVKNAARNFAKARFGGNHEYVMVLHSPENDKKTKQPHVHLSIKILGHDGKRLNLDRDDLQACREGFATALSQQGVLANATPRAARGVTKLGSRLPITRIEERGKSKISALKMKEAAESLKREIRGERVPDPIWEIRSRDRQVKVRAAWDRYADYLKASNGARKENERPDYTRSTRQRAGRVQPDYRNIERDGARESWRRSARLHQSSRASDSRVGSPGRIASLRDVSVRNVVQDTPKTEMFLPEDAHGRLENWDGRAARAAMRRARDRSYATERTRRLEAKQFQTGLDSKDIKKFVKNMPPVEFERDVLRRRLIDKFSKEPEKTKKQEKDIGLYSGNDKNGPSR